ncbi:class E sortase [Georgenia sp. H159]|uniref:class E sortase n=1 Tax=Georgenia sp. H159 TaxID=3076115 RepID=UPI002D79DF42|nr:class E sortase [Georgenia sp. H159]
MATTDVDRLEELPWQRDDDAPSRRTRPRRRRRGFVATFVGVVGELMITAGVLLGLFVVWQLWWTDVEANNYQAEVLEEWREKGEVIAAPPQEAEQRTDPPPLPAVGAEGEVMATLHIPRLGDYEETIAHGTGMADVLNKGYIGHYPETQLPGEVGNFATAAHRQSYGAPYREIEQIVEGDSLIVETTDAYLVYEVVDHEVVHPSQVEVIAPVPGEPGVAPTERMITLTTCHPLFSAAQRWITYGEFQYWIDKNEGMPAELLQEGR